MSMQRAFLRDTPQGRRGAPTFQRSHVQRSHVQRSTFQRSTFNAQPHL